MRRSVKEILRQRHQMEHAWRVEYYLNGEWQIMDTHRKDTTLEKAIKRMMGNHWAIAHDMTLSVHNGITDERIPLDAIGLTDQTAKSVALVREGLERFNRYAAFDVKATKMLFSNMVKRKVSFDVETNNMGGMLFVGRNRTR